MIKIWADRLIAYARTGIGKQWSEVPASRKSDIKAELVARIQTADITAEEYQTITGEAYVA